MTFHCRTTVPAVSRWYEIEAPTPEEAVASFHYGHDELETLRVSVEEEPGGRYSVAFVLVEVVDHLEGEDLLLGARRVRRVEGLDDGHAQELISRVYHMGIYRKGGVKPLGWKSTRDRLVEIASLLDWTKDPQALLAEGWDLEETWDDASDRKWKPREKSA